MKKKLIITVLSLICAGCSVFSLSEKGDVGEPCFQNGTCKNGLECIDNTCVKIQENISDSDDQTDSDQTAGTDPDIQDEDDHWTGNEQDIIPDDNTGEDADPDDTASETDMDLNDTDNFQVFDNDIDHDDSDPVSKCTELGNPCNDSGDTTAYCTDNGTGYECNCSVNYTDNGTTCAADTRTDQSCTGLPANAEWNTVSGISQTWNGTAWQPDTAGYYNETPGTADCRFKCTADHHWDGTGCISDNRTFNCAAKPANSEWNTVSSYAQTWNGSSWTPPDSTPSYSLTGSSDSCRYKCSAGNAWNGSECVASSCSGSFPYTYGSLCWSEPTSTPMTWSNVGTHCSSIGGRLPTISELRKLIKNCPATQTGGSCGVTDTCLAGTCFSSACEQCTDADDGRYSVFGDKQWLWSSQDNSLYTANAWYVNFKSGRVYNGDKNYTPANYDVRCVK